MKNLSRGSDPTQQKSVGQLLREAREAKQITIIEVTQRLLLSKQTIANIESDDYTNIPARVYAEGYLRAYANFLDLSAEELIGNFRRSNLYEDSTPERSKIEDEEEITRAASLGRKLLATMQKYPFLLTLLLLALIILLFGAFLLWHASNSMKSKGGAKTVATSPAVVLPSFLSSDSKHGKVIPLELAPTSANRVGTMAKQPAK